MPDFLDSAADADRAILEAYAAEYRRLDDNWRAVEAKAQGTVAVAGIFAAFVLAHAAARAQWRVEGALPRANAHGRPRSSAEDGVPTARLDRDSRCAKASASFRRGAVHLLHLP